jgi:hypothetical protein
MPTTTAARARKRARRAMMISIVEGPESADADSGWPVVLFMMEVYARAECPGEIEDRNKQQADLLQ